jgi:hypothetical protein
MRAHAIAPRHAHVHCCPCPHQTASSSTTMPRPSSCFRVRSPAARCPRYPYRAVASADPLSPHRAIVSIETDPLTHVRGMSATDLWPWAHKSPHGSLPDTRQRIWIPNHLSQHVPLSLFCHSELQSSLESGVATPHVATLLARSEVILVILKNQLC